ncbi:hypothetical protein D1AOALGA4SA_2577 [Olavius algarvensis Delta 1 endosymbiont]|nr:hypothetical protein D1AOALGA4SA_2577 [Olavius algarvensis Delta 1 endosymbiont]
MFNLEHMQECLIISRWTKLEHCQDWLKNPLRVDLNTKIEKLLATKSEDNIYSVSLR